MKTALESKDFQGFKLGVLPTRIREEPKKKEQINNIIDTAAKRLVDLTDLHEDFILKRLREEYEAHPGDKELAKQNKQLADDWYRSTPEYAEEIAAMREYEAKKSEDFDHLLRA